MWPIQVDHCWTLKLFHLNVLWLVDLFSAATCAFKGLVVAAFEFNGSTLLAKPRLYTYEYILTVSPISRFTESTPRLNLLDKSGF